MINQKLEDFFNKLEDLTTEEFQAKVESHLDDDAIELMLQHLEDFYGIEDDEELGSLCQIMVTGYLAGVASKES